MAAGFIESTSVSLVSLVLIMSSTEFVVGDKERAVIVVGVLKEEVKSREDYLDYFCNGGVRTKLIVLAALLPELGPVLEQRVEGVISQRACAGGVELGFSDLVVVGVEMIFSNEGVELVLIVFS